MVERRRLDFPIIGDEQMIERDTRIIMTNEQLLTKNPTAQDEMFFETPQQAPERPKSNVSRNKYAAAAPFKSETTYASNRRPLSEAGKPNYEYNASQRMPKKTHTDEAKERAKREAATMPARPKQYVSPLERDSKSPAATRANNALIGKQRPLGPSKGMSVADALKNSEKQGKATELSAGGLAGKGQQSTDYFDSKRKNLFDRGNLY